MSTTWTTRSLLAWMARDFTTLGIGTARLDAELLIARVLEIDRVRMYMDLDRPLTAEELSAVRALVVRRRQREPVAYILGHREFYRREFDVNAAVLIPRPDTECLIDRALALLPPEGERDVLDLCTGSGAIAVTLAAERPHARVTATDLSGAALEVAAHNAHKHAVAERMALRQGDLFAALESGQRFDLITANPPYVRSVELPGLAPELRHEPELALVSGADGLDVLRRLCAEAAAWLKPGATLLFEIGAGQAAEVAQLLAAQPGLSEIQVHRDYGGIERVVEAHAAEEPA